MALLILNETCTFENVLEQLDAGLNLTLKDYATLMMIISDNTATDFLFNFLGREIRITYEWNRWGAVHFITMMCDESE